MAGISADEKRWRAESDARTLAEAHVISADSARLKAAQAAAKKMAADQIKQANSMQKVAKTGAKKSTAKPRTVKTGAKKSTPRTTARKKK